MVWALVKKNPQLNRKVALYDLSEAFREGHNCLKLNETKNLVLEEFEMFLTREYEIKLKPFFETLKDAATSCMTEM